MVRPDPRPAARVRPAMDPREDEKRAAAEAAADEVSDGMTVGLGTGTTVGHFLAALARLNPNVACVATSPSTEQAARALGLTVQPFDLQVSLDLAVDGADQVDRRMWVVKGGGGAHTREKVVAAAARRFVVIVSPDKLVERVGPPVPLEVLTFGLASTIERLKALGPVERRDSPPTPDGNVLLDYRGSVEHPGALAATLDAVPGVVAHGLFSPELISEVVVGRPDGSVERLPGSR
jgi:ribose 5-phosphate isomerase A